MTMKQIQGYTVYLTQILGRGSYGNVYRGINQQTKEKVAVKIISKYVIDCDQYLIKSLQNEIKILQSVKSEHIVGFYDVMQSSNNYYIIQELCDMDLSQVIKSGQQRPEDECIEILTHICSGFLALVKEGIIHRDLKPANIMIKGKTYKIGDFGFSKQLSSNSSKQQIPQSSIQNMKMKTTVGTPLYMSIQILKSLEYTSKCDIWALGFIFYQILHGFTPWTGNREYELVKNIEDVTLDIKRKDLSAETVDFLSRCLKVYQKQRISWNEIFVHPIFNGKFANQAGENKEYENQMKSIMTKLRFYFSLNRHNLQQFLHKYGFNNGNEDLSFDKYLQFLRAVNPSITQNEAIYIFKKTDADNSGTISLDQIVEMLKQYGIQIKQTKSHHIQHKNSIQKKISFKDQTDVEKEAKAKPKAEERIKQFFKKLNKIIVRFNLSLAKVFKDFDKAKKGYLTYNEFKTMVQKMSKDITDEQALNAFKIIDADGSNSLEYQQLSKFYREINHLEQI